MPRMIGILVSSLAVLGFVSMAAAAPFATNIAAKVSSRDVVEKVDFKCRKVDGKLVCGSSKGDKNRDNDDDDDDKPKKSKDKVIPKTCGKKVNCEAGFVKLEKPNKYGACCEAREGLPPPKQQEAAKCKFPGQINPPNCDCPPGTEFMGYRGCLTVAKKQQGYCQTFAPSHQGIFEQTCSNQKGGFTNCGIITANQYQCCCNYME